MSMTQSRQPFGQGGNHHHPEPPRSRRRLQRSGALLGVFGLIAAGATYATATPVQAPPTGMAAVGPISSEHGFPVWYQDSSGLRLEQCLDLEDPMCDPVFLRGEMKNPSGEMSFPENFPMESFYMAADSAIELPSGDDAGLTLALEATFASDDPGPAIDEQMVFGRVRIRIDTPSTGTYTVTHPYGVDRFNVTDTEDGINYTQDIGASVLQFGDALKSRINPFLVAEGGMIETPDGNKYIGDPSVPTRVTGSLLGTNFFRIDGPNIGGPGINTIETDMFSLMGKVSTNAGIDPGRVTYSETADGRYLDVFAKADDGDAVTVSADGIPVTKLAGDGANFYARVKLEGAVPENVTITNASDKPVAVKTVPVTDQVTVSSASYDATAKTLTVTATSSDQDAPPALTLAGYEGATLMGGTVTVSEVAIPPSSVTVSSAEGGSDTAPVTIGGDVLGVVEDVTAVATGPATVMAGNMVTLDGSSSYNATAYEWTQIADPAAVPGTDPVTGGPVSVEPAPLVTLTGADTAKPTFQAPAEPTTLWFQLTVQGPGGPKTSDPLKIEVLGQDVAPVATATSSHETALVGQMVTIDGSQSINATSYSWTQAAGTPVSGLNMAAPSLSFQMPNTPEPLAFTLTVTSPTGLTSSATATVSPVLDTVTVNSAELRTRKTEWRIQGSASLTNNNNVHVYLADANGGKLGHVGDAVVEPAVAPETGGTWTLRVRDGVDPGNANRLLVESDRGGSVLTTYSSRR